MRAIRQFLIVVSFVISGAALAAMPSPKEFAVQMENGNISRAKEWLASGMPANFQGSRIGTGLHIGAWEGNIELMELFLSYGGNVNKLNDVGETPATIAAWKGQTKALEWLISKGAKVNTPHKTWSPLHYAVFAGHAEMTDYLINKGANINALSTNGSSVLMMALYEGRTDLAKKLINLGADINPRNDWGDGAFEWAMRYNNIEIAKMISSPEAFAKAMNRPKSDWGTPTRSQQVSQEMEGLLRERQHLIDMGKPVNHLQKPIQEAHLRMIAEQSKQKATAGHQAMMLEISASRSNPSAQKARITEYKTPGAIIKDEKYERREQ